MLVRAAAALAALGMAWAGTGTTPGALAAGSRPEEPRQMLVGLVVAGSEIDMVDVYFDGTQFLLPLEAFLGLCECASARTAQGFAVVTPIGTAMIPTAEILERDGLEHIGETTLRERLAVGITYDGAAYALIIDLPWHGMRRDAQAQGPKLQADARPPALSLSNLSFGAYYGHQRQFDTGTANATVMGRAAEGIWRLRYEDSLAGPGALREYGWLREIGEGGLVLLGQQRFGLHSLLSALELAGAQMAWSNAPVQMFGDAGIGGELLPRQLQSTTTISGAGVPAGIAVLRIDDRQIAATVIGLDGYYEFPGIRLPASRTSRVEVLIYDRQNPTVPIAIQEYTQRASQAMLPGGTAVMQGAFGAAGNPIAPGSAQQEGTVGFVQARYGASDRLTVESTMQKSQRGTEFLTGGILQIGRGLVASGAVAGVSGQFGYSAEIDGLFDGWQLRGRSEMLQAGYRFDEAPGESDQWLEVTRRNRTGSFEVGVVGQYRRGRGLDVAFVLPLVAWRPSARFQMRARPDNDGMYRVDAWWNPDNHWRMGVTRSREATMLDVSRALSTSLRVQLVAEVQDDGGNREAAVLSWFGQGRLSPAIAAGPLLTNGEPGAVVRAQAAVSSGILLGVQYETYSLIGSALVPRGGERDHRVTLSLSGRLGLAGGRVIPGAAMSMRAGAGGIAGHVRVAGDYLVAPEDLQGIVVRVNGRPVARTERGGRYYVPSLTPGAYRVDVNPDGLPIELTLRDPDRVVEVAAGAVTRADFVLDVEFGLAGRVRLGVAAYPGAVVELLDEQGQVRATALADRFGLYRFDGVRVGSYSLRLGGELRDVPGMPTRTVTVRDDFLFDQDLQVAPGGLESTPLREPSTSTAQAVAASGGGFDVAALVAATSDHILPDLLTIRPVEILSPTGGPERVPALVAPEESVTAGADTGPAIRFRAAVHEVVTATAPAVDLAGVATPAARRVPLLASGEPTALPAPGSVLELVPPPNRLERAGPLRPTLEDLGPEMRGRVLRFMSQVYGLSGSSR